MSTLSRIPTTPVAQRSSPASTSNSGLSLPPPTTPQTGTWKHPKFEEIARRQNAATFSDQNVKQLIWNGGGFFALWFAGHYLWTIFPSYLLFGGSMHSFGSWAFWLIEICLLYNILVALHPLFAKQDTMEDIPLTPAQRKLLGLPPSSRPPTPGSEYVTPPRYRRTSTPLSGSPVRKASPASSSPSGRRSDGQRKSAGLESSVNPLGPVYSPSASPLLQQAMMNGNGIRRHSYGSSTSLDNSTNDLLGTPGTPSPVFGKTASVGLNNKWLYDKGRRNSGNAHLYT